MNAASSDTKRTRKLLLLTLVCPLVALLVTVDMAVGFTITPWLFLSAAILLLVALRSSTIAPRSLRLLALALLLLYAVARIHVALDVNDFSRRESARITATLEQSRSRYARLVAALVASAEWAAHQPDALSAFSEDQTNLQHLFKRLGKERARLSKRFGGDWAISIRTTDLTARVWTGRIVDSTAIAPRPSALPRVFAHVGSISTILVAVVPIETTHGLVGFSTAEIHVEQAPPGTIVEYFDQDGFLVASAGSTVASSEHEVVLRGPDQEALALIHASGLTLAEREQLLLERYRHITAVIVTIILIVGLFQAWPPERWRIVLIASLLRFCLLLLTSPTFLWSSFLKHPASVAQFFLAHPWDAWLTSLWSLSLAAVLLEAVLSRRAASRSLGAALATDLLAIPVLALTFAWVSNIVAKFPVGFEVTLDVATNPWRLMLLATALSAVIAGGALLLALLSLHGPTLNERFEVVLRITYWIVLGVAADRLWPRHVIGLPLLPAVLLFSGTSFLAISRDYWLRSWRSFSRAKRSLALLAIVAFLSLMLYPSIVHFSEKSIRQRIESDFSIQVRRQSERRHALLDESCSIVEESLSSHIRSLSWPGVVDADLAFRLWSETPLADFGFSSAVEIQGYRDDVSSRFALDLPSITARPLDKPAGVLWTTSVDRLMVGSTAHSVIHARRLLKSDEGNALAIHVYVADDYWNLPFLSSKDPYSLLARTITERQERIGLAHLIVWDKRWRLLFSSSDSPPTPDANLTTRVQKESKDFWTTLALNGRRHHVFVFADAEHVYALGYLRLGAPRYAADLLETSIALILVISVVLLALITFRSLLGRRSFSIYVLARFVRERFAMRLFLGFVAIAFLPAIVLEVSVRLFIAERLTREAEAQALERASVARKAIEDFALFQGRESPNSQPVTDEALIWISSLVKNDLDVFKGGQLLASSKRELYASGLLPTSISGDIYSAIHLDHQPYVLHTDVTANLAHQVVSMPVRLGPDDRCILSLPLASRDRELAAVLDDLDRVVRLTAVLFFIIAATLAHSMSRRISEPIADLTHAAQRIAQGDLNARVRARSHDELRRLEEAFNQMGLDLERQRIDLERSNRLAAWAEMARQVAHEVKNPLTPIQLSAEHLQRVYGDPNVDFAATLAKCTQSILKQVRALRGIATEFSAFARPPSSTPELVDVSRLLSDVIERYSTVLPPHVTLSGDESTSGVAILGDQRLIERVIVNLIENAFQAIGDSAGSINVCQTYDAREHTVVLSVTDSGPGIAPDLKEKVFEPFFSTKSGGSGLGLWLVRKIVEDHGGRVRIENAPQGGTRVFVVLPVAIDRSAGC